MEPDVVAVGALRAKFEEAREAAPTSEVRAAAVAYYRARAAQGATQPEVAAELGLTPRTLARWHQKHDADGGRGGEREQQAPLEAVAAEYTALRQEIERLGPRSPSRRFPEELKQRVARWVRGELERGVAATAVADQVGVPWESLSRWVGHRPRSSRTASKLRSVRVVDNMVRDGARGPVLKSSSGFIVEGLDVPMLVELLRRLG
jgi:transposase-like protein